MAKVRIDRTSIFLGVVVVLFLWDLIYILRIADPAHFPHPFRIFRLIGDFELFRGFRTMLRQIILVTVPGSLIGIAFANRILVSRGLTEATLRFLRLGIWVPFFLLFTISTYTVIWAVAAAVLCSCYFYLVARRLLAFRGHDVVSYVGRETILQMLFFSLLADLWLGTWKWFAFVSTYETSMGLQVLATIVIFLGFIYWIFRSKFESMASARGIVLRQETDTSNWSSLAGVTVLTVCCFLIWQVFASVFFYYPGPVDVFRTLIALLAGNETIWTDVKISLLEIFLGLILSFAMVLIATGLSIPTRSRAFAFPILPLSHISPVVVYLLVFISLPMYVTIPDWLGVSHKAVAVGLLSFFPLFQAFWGLRNQPKVYRVLMSFDDALPYAFVTMMFGEAMAATAGLGFVMIVANATVQRDKGFAAFLITTALLVCLSSIVRIIARRLRLPKPAAAITHAT